MKQKIFRTVSLLSTLLFKCRRLDSTTPHNTQGSGFQINANLFFPCFLLSVLNLKKNQNILMLYTRVN